MVKGIISPISIHMRHPSLIHIYHPHLYPFLPLHSYPPLPILIHHSSPILLPLLYRLPVTKSIHYHNWQRGFVLLFKFSRPKNNKVFHYKYWLAQCRVQRFFFKLSSIFGSPNRFSGIKIHLFDSACGIMVIFSVK